MGPPVSPVPVRDARHALVDDGPGVQLRSGKVGRGSDDLPMAADNRDPGGAGAAAWAWGRGVHMSVRLCVRSACPWTRAPMWRRARERRLWWL